MARSLLDRIAMNVNGKHSRRRITLGAHQCDKTASRPYIEDIGAPGHIGPGTGENTVDTYFYGAAAMTATELFEPKYIFTHGRGNM